MPWSSFAQVMSNASHRERVLTLLRIWTKATGSSGLLPSIAERLIERLIDPELEFCTLQT